MDPWSSCQENVTTFDTLSLKFEDNFRPTISQNLPDSDQYLASLESKLEKLRNDSNLIQQLVAKRESCMQQLLASDNFAENTDLDLPVNNLRNSLSSRQAFTQGEIVDLLKHDQLGSSESIPPDSDKSLEEYRSP